MANDTIKPAGSFLTNLIGLYMVIMAVLLAYVIFALFPERMTTEKGEIVWNTALELFYFTDDVQPETRLLLLVMAMGAFGSYIHTGTSFVSYVGNRSFMQSWTWWYLLRPFIGMSLAIIFYFVIRGGAFFGRSCRQ